ncbi:adenylylsulfate kinase [Shewanella mangrovi]|uniref:Adenylyl-sulfate kinase n=1 Tax=Shewanella mangrovi TaxID=1515746 RepID=A0A094JAY2_9GAMM|nr:adenylyl-sulfate kinase [Shewanella mangrovi]KFZ37080.1 adenylylsulfate kinase [Shewanella mangrovi]
MTSQKSSNVVWHQHQVSKTDRVKQKGISRSAVLWFTGLSGSGKSTIANAVEQLLFAKGYHSYLLDGDNVRHGLNRDLNFSDDDRIENIRRIGEVSKLFVDSGLIVLTAFISPFQQDRALVRALHQEGEFVEVFIDTPLALCEQRDPKGLYKKARAGEIKHFTGIDSAYEAPVNPEIHVDTASQSIVECAEQIVAYLEQHHYI